MSSNLIHSSMENLEQHGDKIERYFFNFIKTELSKKELTPYGPISQSDYIINKKK